MINFCVCEFWVLIYYFQCISLSNITAQITLAAHVRNVTPPGLLGVPSQSSRHQEHLHHLICMCVPTPFKSGYYYSCSNWASVSLPKCPSTDIT